MVENNHKDGRKEQGQQPSAQPNPLDGLVAASALGMAMAGQAMQIWFGMISGVARAGQEMLDQHNREAKDAPSPAPAKAEVKPAEVQPAPKAAPKPEPVAKTSPAEATVKAVAAGANVVPLKKPVVKTATPTQVVKLEVVKPATTPRAVTPAAAKPEVAKPVEVAPAKAVEAPKKPVLKTKAKPAPKQQTAPKVKEPAAKATKAPVKAGEPAVAVAVAAEKPVVPTAVMPDDFRQPKAIDKPQTPDDLKQIAGVGPKLEKVLNGLGVWTFAQVAAWDRQETAWVDDYLGLNGRMARDGWTGQAQALASGGKTNGLSKVDEAAQNAGGKNG